MIKRSNPMVWSVAGFIIGCGLAFSAIVAGHPLDGTAFGYGIGAGCFGWLLATAKNRIGGLNG